MRECSAHTVILIIPDCDEATDESLWLSAGANGMLSLEERTDVESRIGTAVRSFRERMEGEVRYSADLMVNLDQRRIFRGNDEILLTPQEYRVFCALFLAPGQIVTDAYLLENCLEMPVDPSARNSLSACMSRMRKKLWRSRNREYGPGELYIETIRTRGYRWHYEVH